MRSRHPIATVLLLRYYCGIIGKEILYIIIEVLLGNGIIGDYCQGAGNY